MHGDSRTNGITIALLAYQTKAQAPFPGILARLIEQETNPRSRAVALPKIKVTITIPVD